MRHQLPGLRGVGMATTAPERYRHARDHVGALQVRQRSRGHVDAGEIWQLLARQGTRVFVSRFPIAHTIRASCSCSPFAHSPPHR